MSSQLDNIHCVVVLTKTIKITKRKYRTVIQIRVQPEFAPPLNHTWRWCSTRSKVEGRSVMRGSAAGKAAPGSGCKLKRCKIAAMTRTLSVMAKPAAVGR